MNKDYSLWLIATLVAYLTVLSNLGSTLLASPAQMYF